MKQATVILLLLLVGSLLAGCTTKHDLKPVVTDECGRTSAEGVAAKCDTGPDQMRIAGLVESDTLIPLANATLTILESNATVRTSDLGRFEFPPLTPRIYTVHASLAGYVGSDLVARPDTNAGALDFVLQAAAPVKPYQTSQKFHGFFECGAEAFIITGSCDALVQAVAPGQAVFQNQSSFNFPLQPNWATTVIDVVFDPTAQPGFDGLRIVVRGVGDAALLNNYQQYGRFYDTKPFTARLDPGQNYTDGEAPVTANITAFAIDAYPQGRAYHDACVPTTPLRKGECALGAGAGQNLEFDLYVTVFYVEAAPDGFTLRHDA